jgi:glycosyltransferase involved in cell wall biosynthesis
MGMRILLIHQYFLEVDDSGGSRWNEISKSWTDLGHEVVVIAGMMHANGFEKREDYKGKYFVTRLQNNIKVYRTHVSESYNSGFFGRFWGYCSFMLSSLWAGLFIVRGKYDLILVTSPPLFVGVTGYILSRLKRIPLIFEIRDLWPESAIDTGVLTNKWMINLSLAFESFIYKKAKRINVLTPAFYSTLLDKKGVPADKLIMIPNAADFALSDDLLQNFDSETFRKENHLEDYFVITYVGAHGVANHLDQVLDAAEFLADTNVLFLLIGQGMEKARLINDAKRRGLNNVRFLDSVPKQEVFKYILASDMGASILKRVDTFKTVYSNKTFDYFSCKKPVLMAIDGVSRQLVEDANAGVYVEPENASAYNVIIREYLKDPQRLIHEGENGYQFAKSNFDRQILAEKYINQLIEAL